MAADMTWQCQRLWMLSFALFALFDFAGAHGYAVWNKDNVQDAYNEASAPLSLPRLGATTSETQPSDSTQTGSSQTFQSDRLNQFPSSQTYPVDVPASWFGSYSDVFSSGNPSGSSAPQSQLLSSSSSFVTSQDALLSQQSTLPQGSSGSLQAAPSAQGFSGPYTPTSQQQDTFWTGQSSSSQAIALPFQPQRSPEQLGYASQTRPVSSSQPQLLGGSLTSSSQGTVGAPYSSFSNYAPQNMNQNQLHPLRQLKARLLTAQGASVASSSVRPASDFAPQSGSPYLSVPSQASNTGQAFSSFQSAFQSAPYQFPGASSGQRGASQSVSTASSSQRPSQSISTEQTSSSFQTGFQSALFQYPSGSSSQYDSPTQGAPSSSLRPASDFAQQPSQAVSKGQTSSIFQTGFQDAPSQFPSAPSGQYRDPQGAGIASSSQRPASDFAQQPSQAVSKGQTSSSFQTGFQDAPSQFPSAPSGQYGAPQGAGIASSDFAQQSGSSFQPGQYPSASSWQYVAPGQGAPSSSLKPASDFAQQRRSPFLSVPSQATRTGQTSSSFQSAVSQVSSAPSGQYGAPQGAGIASSSQRPASDFAQQPSQAVSPGQTSSSFQTGFRSALFQYSSASSSQYDSPTQGAPSSSLRPASDFAQQPSQAVSPGQTSSSFQPGFQDAPSQYPSASSRQYVAPSQGAQSSSLKPASDFSQQKKSPFLSGPSQTTSTSKTSSTFQTDVQDAPFQFPSASNGQYGVSGQSAPSDSPTPLSGRPFLNTPSETTSTGQTSSSFWSGFYSALNRLPSAPSTQNIASLASADMYRKASQSSGDYRWPQGGFGSSVQSQGPQVQHSFSQ